MITIKEHHLHSFSNAVAHSKGIAIYGQNPEYIPLPETSKRDQIEWTKKNCKHKQAVPFKLENNSAHGFCCGHCGKVLQWG